MTKTIGIPGWMLGDNSFGVTISYLEFISKFGKPLIITPMDSDNPPEVDMVLAPGGADLLPSTYGAVPGFRTNKPNVMLEHFDSTTLLKYIDRETPIFAICRSMQRIWAMYGGQITQDNPWHSESKNQNDQCHELEFKNEFKDYKKLIDKVTSRHHQCANSAISTPEDLEVIALAKEGNVPFPSIVEIFQHKTLPIFCVQFHPEDHDYTDKLSTMIIRDYLKI